MIKSFVIGPEQIRSLDASMFELILPGNILKHHKLESEKKLYVKPLIFEASKQKNEIFQGALCFASNYMVFGFSQLLESQLANTRNQGRKQHNKEPVIHSKRKEASHIKISS